MIPNFSAWLARNTYYEMQSLERLRRRAELCDKIRERHDGPGDETPVAVGGEK